jgi:cytochrome c oxidase subunit 1
MGGGLFICDSGIYLLFSKAFAGGWLNTICYVHFWVTFIGCYLLFWRNTYEGLAGMPRRYLAYGSYRSYSFSSFVQFDRMIAWAAIIIVVMQVVFAGMIGYSLLKKRFIMR